MEWEACKHTRRSQIPSLATADAKHVWISIDVPTNRGSSRTDPMATRPTGTRRALQRAAREKLGCRARDDLRSTVTMSGAVRDGVACSTRARHWHAVQPPRASKVTSLPTMPYARQGIETKNHDRRKHTRKIGSRSQPSGPPQKGRSQGTPMAAPRPPPQQYGSA